MLLATAPGFARFRGEVDPRTVPEGVAVRIQLEPGVALPVRVGDASRAPIAGATIHAVLDEAIDEPPIAGSLDATGAGTIDFLSPGRWLVTASAPGHASSSRIVTIVGSVPIPTIEVFLLARTGSLDVHVLGLDGVPVAAADVFVGGVALRPAAHATTNAHGVAVFDSLAPGMYEARGARGEAGSRRVTGIVVDPARSATVTLSLVPSHPVGGRFVDARGQPLEGVEVAVSEDALDMVPRLATSGRDGSAIVMAVPTAPHVFVARLEGYLPFGPVIVTPGEALPTITMVRAGTIRGRVVDAHGDPVMGAVVTLLGDRGRIDVGAGTSPLGGAPNLPLVPTGPTTPTLQAAGELGITLGDIPPIPMGAINATPMATSLAPTVASTTLGSITDSNGVFLITSVPPGIIQLVATHPDHPTVTSGARRISSGEMIDGWNLVFPPAGKVIARVVDVRGRPLESVPVELRLDTDDVPRSALTGYDGKATFDGVVGIAILTAMPSGRAAARARAEVAAGRTVEVELRLEEARGRFDGRVVDSRGTPVEGARVEISSSSARSPLSGSTMTEPDGTFFFDALPPPPYRLVVDHPSYATLRREDVRPPRQGRVELRLIEGGTITGTVVDADEHHPIERVIVSLREGDRLVDEDATDSAGRYAFDRIPPARYRIEIRDRDHLPADRPVTLVAQRFEAPRLEVPPIEMIAGFTIRGRVVDALGDAVLRARVSLPFTLAGPVTITTTNGEFELRGVAPGTHELLAEHVRAGSARARRPIRGSGHDTVDGVEVVLPGRISVDEQSRDPEIVRGVAVVLGAVGTELVVDWVAPGGSADAAGIRPGDRLVTVDEEPIVEILRAEELLRGPTDVPAELVVERGGATRHVRVGREIYRPPPPELLPRR